MRPWRPKRQIGKTLEREMQNLLGILKFTRIGRDVRVEQLFLVGGELILPHVTVLAMTIGAGATTKGKTHTEVRNPGRNTKVLEATVGG